MQTRLMNPLRSAICIRLFLFYYSTMLHSSFAASCIQAHYLLKAICRYIFGQLSLVSVDTFPALYAGWGNFTESLSTPSHKWSSVFCLQGRLITVSWITYNWISSTEANMYLPHFLTYNKLLAYATHNILNTKLNLLHPGHSRYCLLLVCICSQGRFSGFSQWWFIHDFVVKYGSTTRWCGFTCWSQSTSVLFYGEKCILVPQGFFMLLHRQ